MNRVEKILLCYFEYLERKGRVYNAVIGLVWAVVIGVFDFTSAVAAMHSFFYLLPIAFVTWFSGLNSGLFIALVCTTFWSANNLGTSLLATTTNVVPALLFFLAIVALLNKTHELWVKEKQLSNSDPLTGAKNLRSFTELVEYEMLRAQRDALPFSLAYLDLDNFKSVNDTYGHVAGDRLLKSIVAGITIHLRKTDVVGRLGGDEFAIFFPETDQAAARFALGKVLQSLNRQTLPFRGISTLSVGVITCAGGVYDFNQLIHAADAVMYEVKTSGKNSVRYILYPAAGRE